MGRNIISLDDVTVNNIGVFKKINEVCLPVSYSEDWYKKLLDDNLIIKLGYYTELPVGLIKGKAINKVGGLKDFDEVKNLKMAPKMIPDAVYIESLAVLPAYGNLGIGKSLLNHLIEETKKKFIHEIVLHVQTTNKSVIEWYEHQGFTKVDEIKDYYKHQGLSDADAFIYSKKI